ncbi:MAG: phosphoglycerate mutase, partial [Arenimonas sp.]
MPGKTLSFLLTERRRFAGQKIDSAVASILGKSDKSSAHDSGEQAQLERHVSISPRSWPPAALTRQLDANDADLHAWLRADPAHVRAEMGVVRLLACGDLGLTQEEADEFIEPLKILFDEVGFPISAPLPSRWYLKLGKEAVLPSFQPVDLAIGADIFAQFPDDENTKRWRVLSNEAQIILHNHPLNAVRTQKGLLPVNSLYFWGGGILPDRVKFHAGNIISDDAIIKALVVHADIDPQKNENDSELVDCRRLRDWSVFEREYLMPVLLELNNKKYDSIVLDFSDGVIHQINT